ncbi:MAG TPA: DUF481 domain-containing protein [Flavisolibacter sp.]|nr:DUF481 domain-containing protein [Flavisolibacter sp.]
MTKKTLVAFFIWVLPYCSVAQFNDSLTHVARFAAAGNINRTTTAIAYLLNNEARFSIRKPRTVLNTFAAWVYGEQGGRLTNNDFVSTVDFNLYNTRGDFYYWGLANYTTSLSLKINHQLQLGLGAAYNFVNTPASWINLSDGLLYETSSLSINSSGQTNYQTVRNSLRLAYRFTFGEKVTIDGTNYIQNSLNNSGDYLIRTNNSAGVKLNKWLSFTTAVSYNQVRRTGSENLLFTYGLTAEKYF